MSKQHYDHNNPNIANKPGAANQPPFGNPSGNQDKNTQFGQDRKDVSQPFEGAKSTIEDKASDIKKAFETDQSDPHNKNKKEGPVAKTIESQTAKIPSDVFLWTSFACMGISLTLKLMKKNNTALFVGQWSTSFLLLGTYNKIVKTMGSE